MKVGTGSLTPLKATRAMTAGDFPENLLTAIYHIVDKSRTDLHLTMPNLKSTVNISM